MVRSIAILAFATFIFLGPGGPATAQSTTGPNGATCMTPMGPAIHMNGNVPAWAMTQIPPMVPQPTIIYGPIFYQLPHFMQVFTSDHECGHANGHIDEFSANCYALDQVAQKGGNAQTVMMIRQFHYNVGQVGPQYGGSGANYWQLTYQRCPQLALQP